MSDENFVRMEQKRKHINAIHAQYNNLLEQYYNATGIVFTPDKTSDAIRDTIEKADFQRQGLICDEALRRLSKQEEAAQKLLDKEGLSEDELIQRYTQQDIPGIGDDEWDISEEFERQAEQEAFPPITFENVLQTAKSMLTDIQNAIKNSSPASGTDVIQPPSTHEL